MSSVPQKCHQSNVKVIDCTDWRGDEILMAEILSDVVKKSPGYMLTHRKIFSTRPVSALPFCESTLQNYFSNRPLQLIFTDNSDLVKAFDWHRSDNLSWFDNSYPAGRFRVVSSEVVHRVHLDDWRVFQFRQRSQFFTFHPQIRLDEDRIIVCCLLPTEGRGKWSWAGPRVSDCTARTQPTA